MQNKFDEYKKIIDKHLDLFLEVKYPEKIWESMRYSVLAEGKRLRPVLVLECCKICGGDIEDAIATACAIEMIHVQSLIHDDLPCMDDDDLRRGKPSNHKAFDEATAVLAGDALLSYAPQIIIQKTPSSVSADVKLEIIEEVTKSAGALALIAGQMVDLDSENKFISKDTLDFIHENKTAKLFELAVYSGAKIALASQEKLNTLALFAQKFGLAFQICDDILDVTSSSEELGKTAGKDQKSGKQTYPGLYGLEQSKIKTRQLCQEAKEVLQKNKLESSLLVGILDSIVARVE